MNIYKTKFYAQCPANGCTINYALTIQTGSVIKVEDIRAKVDAMREGFHEEFADTLLSAFGGSQTLVAEHHGVTIETTRPHIAHWMESAAAPQPPPPGKPSIQDLADGARAKGAVAVAQSAPQPLPLHNAELSGARREEK